MRQMQESKILRIISEGIKGINVVGSKNATRREVSFELSDLFVDFYGQRGNTARIPKEIPIDGQPLFGRVYLGGKDIYAISIRYVGQNRERYKDNGHKSSGDSGEFFNVNEKFHAEFMALTPQIGASERDFFLRYLSNKGRL